MGLSIGSFINCFVWRLHAQKRVDGRSMCPKCKVQIDWYDNVPVLSYVWLKARCRHCKKSISWQYPVVELATGALFVLFFLLRHDHIFLNYNAVAFVALFRDFFIIAVLVVIFIYDLKYYLILDKVTLPAIVLIFGLNLLTGASWSGMLISAIIGGSFFLIQFIVSSGRWIGGGDIRLGFLMGMILGWPNILAALFISYILGSIIGVALISMKKKKMDSEVPFGVFLTFSTVITMLWGSELINWYVGLLY